MKARSSASNWFGRKKENASPPRVSSSKRRGRHPKATGRASGNRFMRASDVGKRRAKSSQLSIQTGSASRTARHSGFSSSSE